MNYYYDEPFDWETMETNIRTVVSDEMIISMYNRAQKILFKERPALKNAEDIIDEFVIVNWCGKTDMPVGQYPSKAK